MEKYRNLPASILHLFGFFITIVGGLNVLSEIAVEGLDGIDAPQADFSGFLPFDGKNFERNSEADVVAGLLCMFVGSKKRSWNK